MAHRDPAPDVRRAAIRLLADTSDDADRADRLREALSDPDPGVRAAAVATLATAATTPFVPLLLAALRDHEEEVWRAAAARLGVVADAELGAVWDAVRDVPEERREAVLAALDRDRPQRLAQLALENLRSPESEERMLAVTLAARAGTAESTTAVVEALADPDPA